MVRRLAAAGFPLLVWDRDSKKAPQFSGSGMEWASTPAELARHADIVMSCVVDGHAVEEVYFSPGGILASNGAYTTILERSTIAPETARRLHTAGERLGISVLDVSISGSTTAAE